MLDLLVFVHNSFPHNSNFLTPLEKKALENIVGKGENAANFLQYFPSIPSRIFLFVAFVKDNATMSSIWYFENHVSYFVQN